jgi:8-oxo-dGTP pyrophosphatase MutT (NUDIX family)
MMQRESGGERLPFEDGVSSLRACTLNVCSETWPFAETHADVIDANWAHASETNPSYFNGAVHLVCGLRFDDNRLDASLLRTDFKSYLYWRQQGFPQADVLDGFGSALLRSADGKIILGRQRAGNVNAGLTYLPAGFIDERDVGPDGSIDIAASVVREVIEETGIAASALVRDAGYYVTRAGPQLSIAVPFRLAMTAADFIRVAERHIALSEASELEAVIPVAARADMKGLPLPRYARLLLETLLVET